MRTILNSGIGGLVKTQKALRRQAAHYVLWRQNQTATGSRQRQANRERNEHKPQNVTPHLPPHRRLNASQKRSSRRLDA